MVLLGASEVYTLMHRRHDFGNETRITAVCSHSGLLGLRTYTCRWHLFGITLNILAPENNYTEGEVPTPPSPPLPSPFLVAVFNILYSHVLQHMSCMQEGCRILN